MNNTNNKWIITLILVVTFIAVRIFGETTPYVSNVVAFINSCSLLYVMYVIDCVIVDKFDARNQNIKIFRKQEKNYKGIRKFIFGVVIIGVVVYICAISCCEQIMQYSSVINDIIAIVAFGISIEDNLIEEKIFNYFSHMA